ncbi:hypothetical protein ACJJTC_001633 [Scirpophaga incertulas]
MYNYATPATYPHFERTNFSNPVNVNNWNSVTPARFSPPVYPYPYPQPPVRICRPAPVMPTPAYTYAVAPPMMLSTMPPSPQVEENRIPPPVPPGFSRHIVPYSQDQLVPGVNQIMVPINVAAGDRFVNPISTRFADPPIARFAHPLSNQLAEPSIDRSGNMIDNRFAEQSIDRFGNPIDNQFAEPSVNGFRNPIDNQFAEPSVDRSGNPIGNQVTELSVDSFGNPIGNRFTEPPVNGFDNRFGVPPVNRFGNPIGNQLTEPSVIRPANPIANQIAELSVDRFGNLIDNRFAEPPVDSFGNPVGNRFTVDRFGNPIGNRWAVPYVECYHNQRGIQLYPRQINQRTGHMLHENMTKREVDFTDPLEVYLSLPREIFPPARTIGLDPNPIIDVFCRFNDLTNNLPWLLDLEFGMPREATIRTIPIYDVKFNSINGKNTPNTIHPGFETCNEEFRRVLLFYYELVVSTWYRGYVSLGLDHSVESYQSWLQTAMLKYGMCWP